MSLLYKFHLARDELADRLGRGLPQGSLVVIEGEYGSGKSLLLERLAYGFLENGHTMTLVSTEDTTNHFVEQMSSLAYPIEDALIEGRLLFLPVYPILAFQGPKKDILDRLMQAKAMYDRDVVAIDCFSTLLHSYIKATGGKEVLTRLENLLYFLKLLCSRGRTIVLTLETADLPPEIPNALKAAADIYLALRVHVTGGSVNRSILVRRFERARFPVADVVPFRVEPKAGFIVEIKNVS